MNKHHIITLGADHDPGPLGAYISIFGCDAEQARAIANALRPDGWAGIYSTPADMERVLSRPSMRCVLGVTIIVPKEAHP